MGIGNSNFIIIDKLSPGFAIFTFSGKVIETAKSAVLMKHYIQNKDY